MCSSDRKSSPWSQFTGLKGSDTNVGYHSTFNGLELFWWHTEDQQHIRQVVIMFWLIGSSTYSLRSSLALPIHAGLLFVWGAIQDSQSWQNSFTYSCLECTAYLILKDKESLKKGRVKMNWNVKWKWKRSYVQTSNYSESTLCELKWVDTWEVCAF